MKYVFTFILLACIGLTSCEDDVTISAAEQLAIDIAIIEDYLIDNNLSASSTTSGLHYIIQNVGIGDPPTLNDAVTITYTGYYPNETIFDEAEVSSPVTFLLADLIKGWQEGLQLMRKEGRATLLMPSALGYGSATNGIVPANSVLIFDIVLVDF